MLLFILVPNGLYTCAYTSKKFPKNLCLDPDFLRQHYSVAVLIALVDPGMKMLDLFRPVNIGGATSSRGSGTVFCKGMITKSL
jgi:hypothetical protein